MNVNAQIYLNSPAEVDMFNDFWKALEADRQKRYGPCVNPSSGLGAATANANIAQANMAAEKASQL